MQDDIQVFRLQQFDQCFHDAQIPCRYIADGGMGYGYPLYNYYSPFPYIVAESFHLLGFSYIDSIKATLIIPSFVRTFGMYIFATVFFGSTGGFLATVLYTLAPYQSVNSYVRGAIGELWALSLLPLVFWSLYQRKGKLSVIFFTALLLSHNLTLIYSIPLLILFSLITKCHKYLFRTLLWSIGISAFFLLPAFFEKNLTTVNTMTQGFFSYIIHFATLKELFISNYWGYSGSMWGPIDGLSLNIGIFQFLIPTIVFIFYLFKKEVKNRFLLIVFFCISLFALFLTHNKSTFIWRSLPFMSYFQFPWRFLGLAIFCLSFIGGGLISLIKKNLKVPVVIALIISIVALNYPLFMPDIWYSKLTDRDKLSGVELVRQSGAGLMDYWPNYSNGFPRTFAPTLPTVTEGQVDFIKYYKKSNYVESYFSVLTPKAIINLPIVYFPNWTLILDGQKHDFQIEPNLGLIQFELNSGEHHLQLYFENTPLRSFANLFSLFAFGSFIILIIREKRS
jgi:hypothetical protein